MEPFNEDAHCVKCACPRITTAYQPPQVYWAGTARFTEPRMKRECSRCGYTWFEKPLDEEPPPELKPGDLVFDALDEKGQVKP